jgi:RHS repeat-associated protein
MPATHSIARQHNPKNAIALRATLARGVIAISDGVGNPVAARGYGTYGETDPAQMVGNTSAGSSAPPALRAFSGSKRFPEPFCALRAPPPKPFGYTGRRWDPDLGLYYHRARWYDPQLGTFLETDPIGSLDYINLYSYVGLEPGNGVDPSGKFVQAIPIIVCAGGGCEAAGAAAAAATALTVGVISKVIIDNVLGNTAPLLFPQPNPTSPQGSTVSESRGKDSGEHTKNARPSTKGKHEAGRARQRQDRGGERGDESRRPPRKPPPNHRGPWPPR